MAMACADLNRSSNSSSRLVFAVANCDSSRNSLLIASSSISIIAPPLYIKQIKRIEKNLLEFIGVTKPLLIDLNRLANVTVIVPKSCRFPVAEHFQQINLAHLIPLSRNSDLRKSFGRVLARNREDPYH